MRTKTDARRGSKRCVSLQFYLQDSCYSWFKQQLHSGSLSSELTYRFDSLLRSTSLEQQPVQLSFDALQTPFGVVVKTVQTHFLHL